MWADQVSANEDPAISIGGNSIKKEISGYNVEAVEPIEESQPRDTVDVPFPTDAEPPKNSDSQEDVPTTVQDASSTEISQTQQPWNSDAPVAREELADDLVPKSNFQVEALDASKPAEIPALAAVTSAPIAFPTSDDQSDIQRQDETPPAAPTPVVSPGVTFGISVNSPPSRTGTPDPDSEPKRKRISSQNFQRLARRISLTTRKGSSSSIIPGLRRDQSPRVSVDDAARPESSTAGTSNDSPAGSIKGDDKGKSKKKAKKDKNKKGTL